jgi:hypothetical protein
MSAPPLSGVVAAIVTTLTELSQLHRLSTLDAFRRTRLGALLLGHVFSYEISSPTKLRL